MATLRIASFDNDAITFEVDYNDGNLRVTNLRCINNSSVNVRGTLIEPDTGKIVGQATFPPGTTEINIPQGRKILVHPTGIDLDYETRLDYPVP